ncbi:MAG: phosphate ABC transporter permease subunit PstC [Alphaproteobacteria bacterium]|nr:phosphate ABC transporter permease subunit PstC [Alphaproteobacteria bacterium]
MENFMAALPWLVGIFILIIAFAAFILCYARARLIERGGSLHSQPSYYAWWGFLLVLLFGFGTYLLLQFFANLYVINTAKQELYAQMPTAKASSLQFDSNLATLKTILRHGNLLDEIQVRQSSHAVADYANLPYSNISEYYAGKGINLPLEGDNLTAKLAYKYHCLSRKLSGVVAGISLTVAMLACACGIYQTKGWVRARNKVEQIIVLALQITAAVAIFTTIAIVASLFFQTLNFFKSVPITDFLFGTVWNPRFAAAGAEHSAGQFGLLPLLLGTLYIAFVAMLVAVPIGLFAAIYMSEYASFSIRAIVKPLLEVLAGIPTIVYGFFAAFTIGPFLRDFSALLNGGKAFILAQSVFTAGLVIGIMLIPFVSSLSDDILNAVPNALRDCSYGLGATKSETIKKVVLPSALPGIVGALLLSASRAIGETMIVVLAAGVSANLTLNPFQAMTTITVKIVSQLTGDLEFNSPQTLVALALGMILFLFTLLMNIFALYIVRKYREQYE